MLIENLPPEAATKVFQRNTFSDAELAEMASDRHEHGPITSDGLILADLWDLVASIAHGLGGDRGTPPRYPRPGVAAPGGSPSGMSQADMDLYLANRKIGD